MNYLICSLVGIAVGGAVVGLLYYLYLRPTLLEIRTSKQEIAEKQEELERDIEAKRKEVLLEAKEEAFRIRAEIEKENKDKRAEIQRLERRLTQKEETLDRRLDNLDRKERAIVQKETDAQKRLEEADALAQQQRTELEKIARLSTEEARDILCLLYTSSHLLAPVRGGTGTGGLRKELLLWIKEKRWTWLWRR